ncbi:ADP-dependent glucokinase/phosphofructokinase [Lacrimispora sp.]|uniref:ADP-dependent glucokinase/phosphofructokinase n=1 Tax=Lacrimispora sp. TaxID=2719234 RepID=UPI002896D61A|nr:ADP-dependent glucokinase/phosphofructokinase [Lacrimispora sp.]
MKAEEKYIETYEKMEQLIGSRIKNNAFTALGYTSNLDVLCDFQIETFNQLLNRYLPNADLVKMKAAKKITGMEEFLETIVYYCMHGIGGEVDISDFHIIKDTFAIKKGMGGTATQGAMALAAVACPSIVHLTDDSKEVCDILNSPYIYTVSREGELVHTDQIMQTAEQEIHYIIQFKKGDVICLGSRKLTIPTSNRLIITKITVNEMLPLSASYFSYVETHAADIKSNVLSSFNAIQDKDILEQRLTYVKEHIKKYKANNKAGIIYFEDAHYHNKEVRQLCLKTLYPYVDILSLNEEELEYTLNMYDFPIETDDIYSCIRGASYIKERFSVKKGIIVHTKNYSMYLGETLNADIEKGLMLGNMLATAKAVNGWYGTKEQIGEVIKLPLSEKGIRNRELIIKEHFTSEVILVPSKYIDKPKYTIGLGDSFVAGVQMCFE